MKNQNCRKLFQLAANCLKFEMCIWYTKKHGNNYWRGLCRKNVNCLGAKNANPTPPKFTNLGFRKFENRGILNLSQKCDRAKIQRNPIV